MKKTYIGKEKNSWTFINLIDINLPEYWKQIHITTIPTYTYRRTDGIIISWKWKEKKWKLYNKSISKIIPENDIYLDIKDLIYWVDCNIGPGENIYNMD